jgi:hypothetical protein
MSVNNFCSNVLFDKYALEDLSTILQLKILKFQNDSMKNNEIDLNAHFQLNEPTPKVKTNDFIYLLSNKNEKINFKWLMPKSCCSLINNVLLNNTFIKCHPLYIHRMIVINTCYIYNSFGPDCYENNLNTFLFLSFLDELSVYTLVAVHDTNFGDAMKARNSNVLVNYLNQMWGQCHFNLNDCLNKMNELKRNKVIKVHH